MAAVPSADEANARLLISILCCVDHVGKRLRGRPRHGFKAFVDLAFMA